MKTVTEFVTMMQKKENKKGLKMNYVVYLSNSKYEMKYFDSNQNEMETEE